MKDSRSGMWRLNAAQLALRKALEEARRLVLDIQFEQLKREFQDLDRLSVRLAKDAKALNKSWRSNSSNVRLLADRLVGYYHRYGEMERRLDSQLQRNPLAERTVPDDSSGMPKSDG